MFLTAKNFTANNSPKLSRYFVSFLAARLKKKHQKKHRIGFRETGICRHHGGRIEGPPVTTRTIMTIYHIQGFKGDLIGIPLCRETSLFSTDVHFSFLVSQP